MEIVLRADYFIVDAFGTQFALTRRSVGRAIWFRTFP
jgi:hypothetical protein